jgi:chemotaxis signal transduction protein
VIVGLPVADIGELLRTPPLRPAPLRHPSTRGLCEWRDRLLPVVDIGGLLGARPEDAAPMWMCVLRHGELALGVLVHEILELQDVEAMPSDADAPLVRRELPIARGILQVLDTAALMAACPESAIGLRRPAAANSGGAAASPHTWLVFEAAGCYAARIECVQEIVPLPEALRPRLEAGQPVSLDWRGHAVPLRPLSPEGAGIAKGDARLLLVVVAGDSRIAIPIAGVKAMVAPRTATPARLRARARQVDVISVAAGAESATWEVVDLEARALAECGMRRAA